MAKILVIRGGAIGDFILTLPAVAALRRQFPEVHLEVLGYPHIVQLALAGGLVDRVQPIEARGLAGFFAHNGELAEDLCDYFSEFDVILSYLYDPDDIFKTNVARCSPAQFIVGAHRPNEQDHLHATQVYLKPLERLAIFDPDPLPRLALAPRSPPRTPQIAIHPGSGSERKNWPEVRWSELLTTLAGKTRCDFLLVGGEVEGQRLQRLASGLPPQRVQIAQSLPLSELAGRLQTCAAFIGHDSGISHLAAALGLPCLVLWADTIEEIWRPLGERLIIVREPAGVRAIKVQRVVAELAALLQSADCRDLMV